MQKKKDKSQYKIRILIKSFDHGVIDEAVKTIMDAAERAGSMVSGPIPLPRKIKKYTVHKSTFVHSRSREQFEVRTHKRLIDIVESTPQTIESLSNLALPAGVDVEIKMGQK